MTKYLVSIVVGYLAISISVFASSGYFLLDFYCMLTAFSVGVVMFIYDRFFGETFLEVSNGTNLEVEDDR